jgi:hypothetical protein
VIIVNASSSSNIDIFDIELAHIFGIRVCTNCVEYALNDTKAYLQQNSFLPTELIKNHIFFDKLGTSFSIFTQ